MKPKILVLTGNKIHHKYFINELSSCGEIVGVIIEKRKKVKLKKFINFGLLWSFSKILSRLFVKFYKDSKDEQFFDKVEIEKKFKNFADKVIIVNNINSESSIKIIQKLSPDYICSLGGGLIKERGISLANKCALNFHSGVSPFYNGADINEKVFESRNLNFIGGTLMIMTPKIDGGKILSHYFPSIEHNDTPRSLFYKGIFGGIQLYKEFISYDQKNQSFNSINQRTPMHYYLGYDHNLMTDLIIKYFLNRNLIKKYLRKDKKIIYYDESSTINDLLKFLKLF